MIASRPSGFVGVAGPGLRVRRWACRVRLHCACWPLPGRFHQIARNQFRPQASPGDALSREAISLLH